MKDYDAEMNWYAVYTKPGCEDSSAKLLSKAGLEILSPRIKVLKRVRGKYADAVEQLFPCYVFVRFGKEEHLHMVKYTRGVKYVVGKERPLIVHPEIVCAIRERMDGGIVTPVPEDMSRGDRVLIKEGPFKDFYGIFERNVPGKRRATILLEVLYCTLHLETRSLRKVQGK